MRWLRLLCATLGCATPRFALALPRSDHLPTADVLRSLIRTNLLSFTDMRDAPEKFFLAHRLLATVGLGGFGVRFTVQFNLFAGSIVGLGGPEQVEGLKSMQDDGALGCFLLTEMQAGVLSGLIGEPHPSVLHAPANESRGGGGGS